MCPSSGTERVRDTFWILRDTFRTIPCVGGCRWGGISLIVVCLVVVCQGLPIVPPRENVSTSALAQAVVYLTQYGYLPRSDPGTGNLRTEDQLRGAIASLQRFARLPPSGVLDGDTTRLMRRRRCGVPDFVEGPERVRRYAVQGQKWNNSNLTWSVKSKESETDVRMVRSQLRKAFEVWSGASTLHFTEVRGGQADIVVSFLKGPHGDGYPFDGEGSVLAHAFFPGEGIGGDAHFDAEERWLPTQPDDEDEGVNLFAVAAHEIGHSLGLSHSSAPGSLMFPYYQLMGEYFKLPKDDADGIRHLYGFKNSENEPTMPTIAPTPPTSTKAPTMPTKKTTKTSTLTPTTPLSEEAPDICNTTIDAISIIRREIFVFKGKFFWRLNLNRTLRSGYPVSIDRFWYALPKNIHNIDAFYERPIDTKIMFFVGKSYWLFSANQLEEGYPRPLTNLGLPADLEHIDAALVWGHNGKTYLFSGKEYWKLDELEGKVELDYPRNINVWRGVPQGIDAAFQWSDGNTYFFRGSKFWKFSDAKMKVDSKGPMEIAPFWFKCPTATTEMPETNATMQMNTTQQTTVVNMAAIYRSSFLYLIIFVLVLTCIL